MASKVIVKEVARIIKASITATKVTTIANNSSTKLMVTVAYSMIKMAFMETKELHFVGVYLKLHILGDYFLLLGS